MSVKELEQAVSVLSQEELRTFRAWFAEFDMAQWDRQIMDDSNSGRLDHLIDQALGEDRAGKTTDL